MLNCIIFISMYFFRGQDLIWYCGQEEIPAASACVDYGKRFWLELIPADDAAQLFAKML